MLRYRIMAQNANVESESIIQVSAQNSNVAEAAQAAATFQGLLNAETNSAAILSLSTLHIFVHMIVGLTLTQCLAVAADGY